MSLHEVVIKMTVNIKDIVIMLEMMVIAVMYLTGSMLTIQQTRGVKRVAGKVMTGALYAELAIAMLWVAFAVQI